MQRDFFSIMKNVISHHREKTDIILLLELSLSRFQQFRMSGGIVSLGANQLDDSFTVCMPLVFIPSVVMDNVIRQRRDQLFYRHPSKDQCQRGPDVPPGRSETKLA